MIFLYLHIYVCRNDSLFGNYYSSTLILLTPTLHGKLYAILMGIICIHAVYQMKYVYTRDINGTPYSNCSVISSKVNTIIPSLFSNDISI